MYPNVHCSTIDSRQYMETAYMPNSSGMHKEDVVHTHNIVLLSPNKE